MPISLWIYRTTTTQYLLLILAMIQSTQICGVTLSRTSLSRIGPCICLYWQDSWSLHKPRGPAGGPRATTGVTSAPYVSEHIIEQAINNTMRMRVTSSVSHQVSMAIPPSYVERSATIFPCKEHIVDYHQYRPKPAKYGYITVPAMLAPWG